MHNKAFKRDSCRVAFLVCGEFCGESGLRKVGLCGIHPLTQRYTNACGRKYQAELQVCSLK
ncbi:TPA: DUF3265 domain-containing protein [Vibrio vulnificus]|nr:DUF3265 domain-containing protein [Vibrio vulnificus]HDY8137122.1 DUF3265 domain-containing protein [Vibrio vulnificus]HDY8150661.1 DUF3265 domain-containing protein [Vibrio vulnificus]HDY8155165.1 DUF3265 domain-containing protein [Vibrio vulnificus]